MFIINPDTPNEEVERIVGGLSETVTSLGGNITKTDMMGRRHLAYPIQKRKEGIYVLFEIDGTGKEIAELERRMRVAEQIMRYISVRVDLDRRAAEKVRKQRERKTARRGFKSKVTESAQTTPAMAPAE
jgi:small subunit ribosomal protein S6